MKWINISSGVKFETNSDDQNKNHGARRLPVIKSMNPGFEVEKKYFSPRVVDIFSGKI